MSDFLIDTVCTFVKFSNFNCPGVGLLTPCFVPRGGILYTVIVPGEGFCSLQVVSWGFVPGGMVLDEIDTCIRGLEAQQISPL